MDLQLIRGDTHKITFNLVDNNGNPYVLTENDKCYFTIKQNYDRKDCVLQKRFGDGIEYNAETGQYEINLTSFCTCEMECANYVYDIKVKIVHEEREIVKTLAKGMLLLAKNATHKRNE